MRAQFVIPVLASILILGVLFGSHEVYAQGADLTWITGITLSSTTPQPFLPGNSVQFSATAQNQGTEPALFFEAAYEVRDPNNIVVFSGGSLLGGGRNLDPGDTIGVGQGFFLTPANIPGTYTITMTVDSNDVIPETDESNNVILGSFEIVLPNTAPDCLGAFSSPETIKKINKKMVTIFINGITDFDGDSITLTITSITQDEPTSGLKNKDKSPDGAGVGTDTAQVRAERDSKGDGRVYEISFTADDGNGGTCSGSANVSVPQNKKSDAIDSGQNFDSTQP